MFLHPVKDVMGYALYVAQRGGKHADAKPLKGYGGAGIVEIVCEDRADTFRTIYTVQLAGIVYVLQAFQKKSKTRREAPKPELEMIYRRLRDAEQIAKERDNEF